MKKDTTPLEQWQIADAERLKGLFKKRAGKTQADFGAEYEIGGQAMVWQYLNAHRPLNIKAAQAFAKGLEVPIDEFSPTIAEQVRAASGVVATVAIIQGPNTARATATLGPSPYRSSHYTVSDTVSRIVAKITAAMESGVPAESLEKASGIFDVLSEVHRANVPLTRSIDESGTGSESAQVQKGQKDDADIIARRRNREQIGHDDKTGTTGGSR